MRRRIRSTMKIIGFIPTFSILNTLPCERLQLFLLEDVLIELVLISHFVVWNTNIKFNWPFRIHIFHHSSLFLLSFEALAQYHFSLPLLFFSLPVTNSNTTGALLSVTFCILSLLCSAFKASRYWFVETTAYFLFPFDVLMKITTILWEISNYHPQTKAQLHSFVEAIIERRLSKITDN